MQRLYLVHTASSVPAFKVVATDKGRPPSPEFHCLPYLKVRDRQPTQLQRSRFFMRCPEITCAELLRHALSATAALDIARQIRTLMPGNNGGKLRVAMSRKNDTSQVWLDRAYPHHVALPADKAKKLQKRILIASAALNTAPRTRTARRDSQIFVIYRFANKTDAQDFIDLFGGDTPR